MTIGIPSRLYTNMLGAKKQNPEMTAIARRIGNLFLAFPTRQNSKKLWFFIKNAYVLKTGDVEKILSSALASFCAFYSLALDNVSISGSFLFVIDSFMVKSVSRMNTTNKGTKRRYQSKIPDMIVFQLIL